MEKFHIRKNIIHTTVRSVLLPCMLFCCKISFFEIYAVLSQNLFCRDLRSFYVEKNWAQNFVRGEKITNIMYAAHQDVPWHKARQGVPPPLPRLTRGTIRVSKVSAGGVIPCLLMSYCSQSFLSSYPRFPLMPPFLGNANCTLWLLNNTIVLRTSYTFWGPVILCEDHLYFVRTTHIKYTIKLQAWD